MNGPRRLVLASASPRRAALLRQIGIPFTAVATAVDETPRRAEGAEPYVRRAALAKARAVAADLPVLGADTTIVLEDELFGKPPDRAAFMAMMGALSGREHRALTAVALRWRGREEVRVATATVEFRPIERDELTAYWATGEPRDKAGGYGIQGIGAIFVRAIRGSYGAVVGLPLADTEQLLCSFGIGTWQWRRQGTTSLHA